MTSLVNKMPSSTSAFLTPNHSQPQHQQNGPSQPRRSTDTEHRHLLADDRSIAPSESASYLRGGGADEDPGERTPRAHSPAPPVDPSSSSSAAAAARPGGNQQQIPRRMTIGNPETSSVADSEASAATNTPRPYRGFPSEEAYVDALRAWAEERSYLHAGEHTLLGFYGNKTMQEYASDRPLEGLGLRKKWRARKERKAGERDRAKSVA